MPPRREWGRPDGLSPARNDFTAINPCMRAGASSSTLTCRESVMWRCGRSERASRCRIPEVKRSIVEMGIQGSLAHCGLCMSSLRLRSITQFPSQKNSPAVLNPRHDAKGSLQRILTQGFCSPVQQLSRGCANLWQLGAATQCVSLGQRAGRAGDAHEYPRSPISGCHQGARPCVRYS